MSEGNKNESKQAGPHKTKKLLHSTGSSTMKRPPVEWETVFASHVPDKGLIPKAYGELREVNSRNPK